MAWYQLGLSKKAKTWIIVAVVATLIALAGLVTHLALVPQHPSQPGIHWVGECPDAANCNYIHKTFGILSDGAHVTAEATVDLVENAIELVIILLVGRWALKREHARIDAEHGYVHEPKSD
jgi:hypothetical protein